MREKTRRRVFALESEKKETKIPEVLFWIEDEKNPRPYPEGWEDEDLEAHRVVFRVHHVVIDPEEKPHA